MSTITALLKRQKKPKQLIGDVQECLTASFLLIFMISPKPGATKGPYPKCQIQSNKL